MWWNEGEREEEETASCGCGWGGQLEAQPELEAWGEASLGPCPKVGGMEKPIGSRIQGQADVTVQLLCTKSNFWSTRVP